MASTTASSFFALASFSLTSLGLAAFILAAFGLRSVCFSGRRSVAALHGFSFGSRPVGLCAVIPGAGRFIVCVCILAKIDFYLCFAAVKDTAPCQGR